MNRGLFWWPKPSIADLVWCWFPQDKILRPGPKLRPALIVKIYNDYAPNFFVLAAYGTSQKTDRLHSGEFVIARRDGEAWRTSGLGYETKFNFRQTVELPFNNEWFAPAPGAPFGESPKLGLLHPALMRRAQAAWNSVKSED